MPVPFDVFRNEPEEQLRPILEAFNDNGTVTNTLKPGQPIIIEYAIITTSAAPVSFIAAATWWRRGGSVDGRCPVCGADVAGVGMSRQA